MPAIAVERTIGDTKRTILGGLMRYNGEKMGKQKHRSLAVSLVMLLGWAGFGAYYDLMHAEPDPVYTEASEHFKYGVLGLGGGGRR